MATAHFISIVMGSRESVSCPDLEVERSKTKQGRNGGPVTQKYYTLGRHQLLICQAIGRTQGTIAWYQPRRGFTSRYLVPFWLIPDVAEGAQAGRVLTQSSHITFPSDYEW